MLQAGIKLIESGKKAKAEVRSKSRRPSVDQEDGQVNSIDIQISRVQRYFFFTFESTYKYIYTQGN